MSYQTQLHRTVRVAALSLGLALLGLPAFAQDAAQSDYSDYYASIGNPHPEITMPRAGVFATTGSGAPYQGNTTHAAVPPKQSETR